MSECEHDFQDYVDDADSACISWCPVCRIKECDVLREEVAALKKCNYCPAETQCSFLTHSQKQASDFQGQNLSLTLENVRLKGLLREVAVCKKDDRGSVIVEDELWVRLQEFKEKRRHENLC